jgi:electron-transferring-flavoprotein dehydrogenase
MTLILNFEVIMSNSFRPIDHQPRLKVESFIIENATLNPEAVPMDVLFVGAGPAGLAGAIRLAQLVKKANATGQGPGDIQIGVLEKAAMLGGHTLSGAVMNPDAIKKLFPDLPESEFPFRGAVKGDQVFMLSEEAHIRLPTPPTMHNKGNYVVSLCEVVRWMGTKAEELGVNVFTSFPAESLLTEGRRVVGVRTVAQGLDRHGKPGGQHMPATDLTAKVTVLSEGSRGPLTQAYLQWQKIAQKSPQIFALGVKELWRVKRQPEKVTHTLGWPLPSTAFGGSWIYPVGEDMLSFGLVAGLDYKDHTLDVHALLQKLKNHPVLKPYLEGGELLEWGAKTIPEGGLHAIPESLTGDGLMMIGDTVGFVNVPALKGIHYAMESGMLAADSIFKALITSAASTGGASTGGASTGGGVLTRAQLSSYDQSVRESCIWSDLKKVRNMRHAFKDGFWMGSAKAALMTATLGAFPGDPTVFHEDAEEAKNVNAGAAGSGAAVSGAAAAVSAAGAGIPPLSKVDGVYRSGNKTRDDIPSHLTPKTLTIGGPDLPRSTAEMYVALCPAGVYEIKGDQLVINAPNCVDCKATDVLGPRWQPREGGSGPNYNLM